MNEEETVDNKIFAAVKGNLFRRWHYMLGIERGTMADRKPYYEIYLEFDRIFYNILGQMRYEIKDLLIYEL